MPDAAPPPGIANEPPLLRRHLRMVTMRAFEEACLAGFTAREIHGELHLGIGQEAVAAGMADSLRPGDALVSTHRNHLHGLAKGVDPQALMAEVFERETGLCRGRGGHMHPFDPSTNFSATGIVGSSIPVAAGYAYGFAMESAGADSGPGPGNVAVAVTGEGGANQGAFHEVLNMAAAWRLPLVVLVENNGWAISVPAAAVMATATVAERGAAYGIAAARVDGRDVEAMAAAFATAMDHARSGRGPFLLEATCSRFRGHYEGDADSYRPRAERQRMRAEDDPLTLSRPRLLAAGVPEPALAAAEAEARAAVAAILDRVRAAPMPPASEAGRYVFAGIAP